MNTNDKPKKKAKPQTKQFINWGWVATITVLSFLISVSMSYISSEALANVGNISAFIILLIFIGLGIIFDIVGVAATSSTEKEFHSMAAKKVKGAKQAVWISRNAGKVSSFCNDVVGDIAGIISGATGAIIISRLTAGMSLIHTLIISLAITGSIAAMTIGGKAIGKGIGIGHSVNIIFTVGKFLAFLPIKMDNKK